MLATNQCARRAAEDEFCFPKLKCGCRLWKRDAIWTTCAADFRLSRTVKTASRHHLTAAPIRHRDRINKQTVERRARLPPGHVFVSPPLSVLHLPKRSCISHRHKLLRRHPGAHWAVHGCRPNKKDGSV